MKNFILCLSALGFVLYISCGKNENKIKVKGVAIPDVKPKVVSATPNTLNITTTTNLRSEDEENGVNPAEELKSRLFTDEGPTALFSILDEVDSAMASIEQRVNGQEVESDEEAEEVETDTYLPCLGDVTDGEFVPKDGAAFDVTFDFDQDGTVDLDPGFTTYLNCYDDLSAGTGSPVENLDSEYWRAFGRVGSGDDEKWYIVESSDSTGTSDGTSGSAVEVSKSKDYVNMWFRVGRSDQVDQSKVIAHLIRHETGLIEYTHTGVGVGFGCGLHGIISKSDHLAYFHAATAQGTNASHRSDGVACADFTDGVDVEYCIDISTTDFTKKADTSECTAAGLTKDNFSVDTLNYKLVEYDKTVHAFNFKIPDGVALFKGEDTPTEEE